MYDYDRDRDTGRAGRPDHRRAPGARTGRRRPLRLRRAVVLPVAAAVLGALLGLPGHAAQAASPTLTSSTFMLGATFTSRSPAEPGTDFPAAAVANLAATTDASNQHLLNFGGTVGDGCTVNNGGTPGDTDWAHYDWSSVDNRVRQMQRIGSAVKMITLHAAPVWMTGTAACDWNRLATAAVLPQYNEQWADFVHYAVQRYLAMGGPTSRCGTSSRATGTTAAGTSTATSACTTRCGTG